MIDSKEFQFAVAVGVLGFLFSTRDFLMWLNGLDPLQGLLFYYFVLGMVLAVLYKVLDIKVGEFHLKGGVGEVVGSLLILFSFFLVTNFGESCLTGFYIHGNCSIPNIFIQSEDGALWSIYSRYTADVEVLKWLTYVITPFVFTLIGVALISRRSLGSLLHV